MIVLSLDEGGIFEFKSSNVNKANVMIGGAIFQCTIDKDVDSELKRLHLFFESICKSVNARFPQGLHPERDANGSIINGDELNRVKTALINELPDFLHGRGTWGKSHGTYYLYGTDRR